MHGTSDLHKVAFLGDYLPRKCGIATFTTDLCRAVAAEFPTIQCLVVPVNDIAEGYDYPAEVRFEIAEQDLTSYLRASDFLNITDVDVVCPEHEFGIFGGPAGGHVLALLRELQMPIVTTLHTILREPNKKTIATDRKHEHTDVHLRSAQAVNGYRIKANDGIIGHACDFIMDDKSWAICQLVVKTGHRFTGKEVQIPVGKVDRISYEDSTVFVNLTIEAIEQGSAHGVARVNMAA